jgi:hypothetical protein
MQLQSALVPAGFQLQARLAGEACLGQRLPQRRAVGAVARAVDLRLRQITDQGTAAEEAALEMALLIGIALHWHNFNGLGALVIPRRGFA